MFSAPAAEFADARALAAALAGWCAAYPYGVRPGAGNRVDLLLPHRSPLPWHRPLSRRRLFRRGEASGAYEPVATAAFDFFAPRLAVPVLFDLGAEIGYFSLLAAARQDMALTAHAFEMRPDNVERLVARAAELGLSGRIHAHLSGMTDRDLGHRDIWFSLTRMFEAEPPPALYRDPWWIRLKFRLRGRKGRDRLLRARVHLDSLDAFVARTGIVPGLVKIDIDGGEARAVPGGMETFARHRPVIFLELHRHRFYAQHGARRADIVRPLLDLGYAALLMTNHHSLARNRVVPVGPGDRRLARDATDFLVLA